MNAIEIRNLSKSFRGMYAVDHLYMTVPEGAIYGFIGENLVMCLISKILLVGIFVPIYLIMSVIAKPKLWLSLILSMAVGMFLFMMIPMLTPLDATEMNPILCIAGGLGLGFGLGAISNVILRKTSLV